MWRVCFGYNRRIGSILISRLHAETWFQNLSQSRISELERRTKSTNLCASSQTHRISQYLSCKRKGSIGSRVATPST